MALWLLGLAFHWDQRSQWTQHQRNLLSIHLSEETAEDLMCWLLDRSWTSGTPLFLPFLNLCQAAMWHQYTYSWNTAASTAWSLRLEFCLLCPARLFSLSIPQTHHLGRYCFPIYSQGTESVFRSIHQKKKLLTFGNALLDGYSISQLILHHPPSLPPHSVDGISI